MAENHNFFNLAGWENILHSLPFNHKIIHYKYGPTPTCLRSHLVQNKDMISCHTYLILWLSSQLKECIMWLKIVQFARIQKIVAYSIKNDWIYNSNNNCVLMIMMLCGWAPLTSQHRPEKAVHLPNKAWKNESGPPGLFILVRFVYFSRHRHVTVP